MMNNELSLLIEKHTNTLIEEAKTKPPETLAFVLKKQMDTFSSNPPINLSQEGELLLTVTSYETTNSVFNITNKNNSFLISTPANWSPEDGEELINKLNILLELRSANDIELHVKEVKNRGTRIDKGSSG